MPKATPDSAYARAGVDIDIASDAVNRMKSSIASTATAGVLTGVGSFGGMFALSHLGPMDDPVLVSSIDGVGTKLKIAFATDRHDTIGRDLVSHCANDILVQGARPLFFLDYFGTGKLVPEAAASVVAGLAEGCRAVGCALIGGETAEMPGMYRDGEYDLAGCIVGLVERRCIIDGTSVEPGDVLLGLASDGLHTNGYSLARWALLEQAGLALDSTPNELGGMTLADALLLPHRCYSRPVLSLLESAEMGRDDLAPGCIHAISHITGGGFYDNIPRVLPNGVGARINTGSWETPPLFELIQRTGDVSAAEMYRVFNMGIGIILAVSPGCADPAAAALRARGERVYEIGTCVRGADVELTQ